MSNKKMYTLTAILITSLLITSCSTVPLTGRRQLDLIPSSTMLSMSFQQYDQFLSSNQVSSNQAQTQMVQNVGRRIQKAVEQYMTDNGLSSRLRDYKWEFNLVDSPEVNAWAMPGGKVVVYSGILPIAKDESGLAVIMGHEIAHAIAKHGDERMSRGLLTQLGTSALSAALQNRPAETQRLWMGAFGAGAQYGVMLPHSRLQESEADRLGLIYMAMAGYDPQNAVSFWQRMDVASGGGKVPEFLSTHPSGQTRIKRIKQLLPEAFRYYRQ